MRLRTVTAASAVAALAAAALAIGTPPVSAAPAATLLAAPPAVDVANVNAHLQQLQNFATANGGNRATGTAGHTATTTYLQQKLTAAGYTVTAQTCTTCTGGAAKNIIADWPGGDTANTYMFGAHSDGVSAGPGINDDGSGTATLLEAALVLAANNPTMTNHVRFGWWAGEEQGLIGSKFYVNSLTTAQKTAIKAYGTFDMIASTNGGYFVTGTDAVAVKLREYFTSINVPTETSTECCSDDGSFRNAGIPASINSTGASYTKTSAQVTKWGGTAGAAYDPCYHKACDTYPSNINATSLARWGNAELYAAWTLTTATSTTNDFSLTSSPASASVNPGSSATATIATAVTSGSPQTVALTASGLPSGVTASFSPSSMTAGSSSTLTLATTSAAAAGTYAITITGTGAAATRTATFALTVNGAGGSCSGTNAADVTISDNATVNSPIAISGCSRAASASSTVEIHIVHTYIGDLVVSLVAPDGSVYALRSRTGGSTDNIDTTYTVNLSSETAPNGTWNLRVQDAASADTGYINSWTLTL